MVLIQIPRSSLFSLRMDFLVKGWGIKLIRSETDSRVWGTGIAGHADDVTIKKELFL